MDGANKEPGIDVGRVIDIGQIVFRVGWWMENTDDFFRLHGHVNQAIVKELKYAGILMPYSKGLFDVNSVESGARESIKAW